MLNSAGARVSAKLAFSALKAIAGLAISALLAFNYGWVFAYTHPAVVYGALAISFTMFTAPIWMNMFGRPMRSWPVYYLFVAVILFLGVMGRFVIEALVRST